MYLLIRWVVSAVSLLLVAYLLPGVVTVSSLYTALVVALILGLLNAIIRPVLIILTLPVTLLTLGLFVFVINGLIFWFAASFVQGFAVSGFWAAVVAAALVSLISWIGNSIIFSGTEKTRTA